MKLRFVVLAALLVFTGAATAQLETAKPPIALSEAQETRFKALLPDLRCLVCQNESLADSQAPLAADLRYEIRGMLAKGATDTQVKKYLTDRYGQFILYRPVVSPRTYLLWFGPLLLVMLGLVTLLRYTRRPPAAQTLPAVDRAALRRVLDEPPE